MPRRHREQILEYTKTVTVTEVVNNSPQCHPGTCEVTVTNIDSGSGHPVSVNISHLHETICQENGSGRCSPIVHVRETVQEDTSTETVEKVSSCIERILRVETEGDVSFKECGDNVIDLSFTTPTKPAVFSQPDHPPGTTLYYHSFKKETITEGKDLISPDSALSGSPKRYMRSDDSDSDSGSMIIHSPVARPDSGVSSTAHRVVGNKHSVSVGSSEEDDLHYKGPSVDQKDGHFPYYIVTSMSETQSPNTALFTDIDTSGTTTTIMNESFETQIVPRYKRDSADVNEKRKSLLVVTNVSATPSEDATVSSDWSDSTNDKRRRVTMEVLFTPPTPKENGAPPKPPRRTKYGSSQLVEHVQHYKTSLDEMSEGPKMTSTPISTLDRKSANTLDCKKSKADSVTSEETPIMSSRKNSRPPALAALPPDSSMRQPVSSPRRSPSSPIIVVDQERRSSMDLLVLTKQPRRKSTITDIDWFAAFNMKEPTTPKSPRSPMIVDALREVENSMNEKRPRKTRAFIYDLKPLSPSKIDLDVVFTCMNASKKTDKECTCNACNIMKMTDEELKQRFNSLRKSPSIGRKYSISRSHSHEERRQKKPYADSHISIDEVFSPSKRNLNDHAKEREESVSSTNKTLHESVVELLSSENELQTNTNASLLPPTDIRMDDVFNTTITIEKKNSSREDIKQKIFSAYEIVETPPVKENAKLNVKENKKSTEETEVINMETIFSPKQAAEEKVTSMALKIDQKASSQPEDPEYYKSDISLDDIFVSPSSLYPTTNQETIVVKRENEAKKIIPIKQVEEKKKLIGYGESDIYLNVESIKAPSEYSTKETSCEIEITHQKLPEDFHLVYNQTPQQEQKIVEKTINYNPIHISLDEIFAPSAPTAPLRKGKEQSYIAEEKPTAPPRRVTEKLIKEVSLDEMSKIPKTERTTSKKEEQCTAREHCYNENNPVSIANDGNWLEELLAPNIPKNEEELKNAVRQLYEKVIPSNRATLEGSSVQLNETMESGYTSLDQSKTLDPVSQNVSFNDSLVNLDDVFGPINYEIDVTTNDPEVEIKEGKKIASSKGQNSHIIQSKQYQDLRDERHWVAVDSKKEETKVRSRSQSHVDLSNMYPEGSSEVPVESIMKKTADENGVSWIESIVAYPLSQISRLEPTSLVEQHIPSPVSVPQKVAETAQNYNTEQSSKNPDVDDYKSIFSIDWIESMIEKSKEKISKSQVDHAKTKETEETPKIENILALVFNNPCESLISGKKCLCSACKLAKLSPEELKEFWSRVKETKNEAIPVSEGTGSENVITTDDRTTVSEIPINLNDVLNSPNESLSKEETTDIDAGQEKAILRDTPVSEPVVEQRHFAARQRSLTSAGVPTVVDLDDILPISINSSPVTTTEVIRLERMDKVDTHVDSGPAVQHVSMDEIFPLPSIESANMLKITEDSWIEEVIRANSNDIEEPDTFEASYLQSIKESEWKNNQESNAYNDYYRDHDEPMQRKHSIRRHVDDYYDEPEQEYLEEIDVAELVDDILASSLNEAAFKVVSTSNYQKQDSHHTDTSVDKKVDNSGAMYLSTAIADNRLESVLSYPPSTSSPTTPRTPHFNEEMFVSEASMVMSHPCDDDYIIRLVFANQPVKETQQQEPAVEKTILNETSVITPNSHSHRRMSRTDEEVLEVEVNHENFVIKGNYSIVINKHDPLGVLLSQLTSGSTALDFSITPKIRRLLLQCLREKVKPNIGKSLSSRGKDILDREDPAYKVFYEMSTNRYSPINTKGNINLCTAENNVCNEMVEERFRRSPELFMPDYNHIVHYGPPGGYPEIKSRLTEYLREEYSAPDVDENNIILLPSGNSTYDMVSHCLFDSEDVILTNAPTYSRNFLNVSERAQCHLVTVNCDLKNPKIVVDDFERVYNEKVETGHNVKSVIIINPHNPLGIVFPSEDLKKLAKWAEKHGLWFIVDESFSQCVHDSKAAFDSFLKLQSSLSIKSVWFWSLSKDFGLPGVKLSVVSTNDRDLHHALCQLELTQPVSSLAQDFVANFLSDRDWLTKFKHDKLARLSAHYNFVTENLKNLGIPYQPATAGIFVFINFSEKLSTKTNEAEQELWRKLLAKGVFLTPGSHTKCPEPGWMRLVFACDKNQLAEGFRRLYELFDSHLSIVGEISY